MLHQYLAHFQDSLSLDCCVFISRKFRNPFHSTVPLVNRAPLRFSFTGLLHQYLAHFQDSFSLDCCVCISRTFRNPFHSIVTLVSRARFRFSFFRLLHQYIARFQDSLSLDCCVCISRTLGFPFIRLYISFSYTFRILLHWIVMFVSRALLGFSIIGLLRLYLTHF